MFIINSSNIYTSEDLYLFSFKTPIVDTKNKKEKMNLNIIVISVILEHMQKYYLHDIVKQINIYLK